VLGTSRFVSRTIVVAVALAAVVAGVAAVRWSARYRLGTSWDEQGYTNYVVQLVRESRREGIVAAVRSLRWTDQVRPPMYRAVALPVAQVLGTGTRTLRALSLITLLLTGALLYATARLVADRALALFASAAFVLSYAPLWASMHFGTEYGLYLGTTGLFYVLLRCALRPIEGRGLWLWLALGASVALGLLSKGTFLLIVVPAVPVFLLVGWRTGLAVRTRWLVGTATLAGFLAASPWYAVNYPSAIQFARNAYKFVRHAAPWLPEAYGRLLGPPLAVLFVVLLVVLAVRRREVRQAMSSPIVLALSTCVAGAVPMIIFHMSQLNHLMRLVSPALIPTVLGGALLAQAAGIPNPRHAVVMALAILLQSAWLFHNFETTRIDEWDWTPLRDVADQRGVPQPVIKFLGSGVTYNPPSISYPWILQGRPVEVDWLWRYEQGPMDWSRVDAQVSGADVVVTAPDQKGNAANKEPEDNQYNAQFAAWLERQPAFDPPVELRLGPSRIQVLVFFRKHAAAGSPGRSP